ncbi:MAG: heavy metal translocating P-type ATPase [Burkholderiales bacterium]|jgi:Cu2+-exporting ATPase|nr:heavy metal translocating P-type ATPase [Burkholderiales bacterium]
MSNSATSSIATPEGDRFCYHCGIENPRDLRWQAELNGKRRTFCCAGCQAIAQTIHASGLSAFYSTRTAPSQQAAQSVPDDEWSVYDEESVAREYVLKKEDGVNEISLLVDGMTCGACVWLIESWLLKQSGVVEARVNYASRRATLLWRADVVKLSALLRLLSGIGYRAYPYDPNLRDVQARREKHALTFRLGVALCCMMQVMMMAVPGYLGGDDIAFAEEAVLRWGSFVLTLPVLFYSASPFFRGALRDFSMRRLGMDVPISLGLIFAFIPSVWHTLRGDGAVYYDSVTMFVALLLVARFVELAVRQRSGETIEAMARQRPMVAERFDHWHINQSMHMVTAASLNPEDIVLVRAGAIMPADGVIIDGESHVDEAMLTGESWPQRKVCGDTVFAGSVNRENALIVKVSETGEATRLATILRLVDRAAGERPRVARIADKVAFWFVGALLVFTVIVGAAWLWLMPSRALEVVFTLLVISCPCALSLATPTALSAAAGALGKLRVVLSRSDALETLAKVTTVIFDKTGTLTEGKIRLTEMQASDGDDENMMRIARALEMRSEHPVAQAFHSSTGETSLPPVSTLTIVAGMGVEGVIDGKRWRIGKAAFLDSAVVPNNIAQFVEKHPTETLVFLGDEQNVRAVFALGDQLRPDAKQTIARLKDRGIKTILLSGDRAKSVHALAETLHIEDALGELLPEDKREYIIKMQQRGEVVAMIGDGINDTPALAQAQISVSLGSATPLAQWTADVVILSDELPRLTEALVCARRTLRIIRQNLTWAACYNILAIPAAAFGYVTPLLATVGMSVSSLIVVLNAFRGLKIKN